MKLSNLFIDRPVATSLLMVACTAVGLLCYTLLPVSALPEIDYPTIQVSTRYPGASASIVSRTVTAPLERRLGQMQGLSQMQSVSATGMSAITVRFALSLPIDVAEQEVQEAINGAATTLPALLPSPPSYYKVNPADPPVLTLSLTSDLMPLDELADFADTRLVPKLSQLSGVGLVSIAGGQRRAVRVRVNMAALTGIGQSMEDVRGAIVNGNVNQPKGLIDGRFSTYAVGGNDQLDKPRAYEDLVVAYRNQAPIVLGTVATASSGPEDRLQSAWVGTRPAVILTVQRQPGANVIRVADSAKALLPKLAATLPPGVRLDVITDRTETIRASMRDVQWELLIAMALVVAVVYGFLRSARATIIPAVCVPLSIIGTLAAMYAFGFSLNNLTLMALTIATGFVVDDAIVVVENISRLIEDGATRYRAAVTGTQQIAFTVASLSVALIAVMTPLLFMSDILGRFFRELAVTLSAAIIVSAGISLSLAPMMAARVLLGPAHAAEPPSAGFATRVTAGYARSLRWVAGRRRTTLGVLGLMTGVAIACAAFIPKNLFRMQDTGLIDGIVVASPVSSFEYMETRRQLIARTALSDPAVASAVSILGVDVNNPASNCVRLQLRLKPREQRDLSSADIARRLATRIAEASGMQALLRPVEDLNFDDQVSYERFRLGLESADPALIERVGTQLIGRLGADPVLADVGSLAHQAGEELFLDFDRAAQARLGVTQQQVDDALYDAYGQRQVSTIYTEANQYRVVLESAARIASVDAALASVYVPASGGGLVPLAAMARPSLRPAPLVVARKDQFEYADIAFNLAPDASLDKAIAHVRTVLAEVGIPTNLDVSFEGTANVFLASQANQLFLVAAAIFAVYITLGVLYESFIHPLTILSTLPSAMLGALLALWIGGTGFDVMGLIGIVLLIGIVMKNAIMMVDFALRLERQEGLDPLSAILSAARLRFRPIVMTTVASLFGALPLALGTGMGAELRQPLGIAIIGGLLISQLVTLYSTPVVYLTLHRAHQTLSTLIEERA